MAPYSTPNLLEAAKERVLNTGDSVASMGAAVISAFLQVVTAQNGVDPTDPREYERIPSPGKIFILGASTGFALVILGRILRNWSAGGEDDSDECFDLLEPEDATDILVYLPPGLELDRCYGQECKCQQ